MKVSSLFITAGLAWGSTPSSPAQPPHAVTATTEAPRPRRTPGCWEVAAEDSSLPMGSMAVWAVAAEALSLGPHQLQVVRQDVLGVPGAFLLHNVLSPSECEEVVTLTEQLGYMDVDTGKNTQGAVTALLDEEAALLPLFERVAPHLRGAGHGQRRLAGLNQRCRFYRYRPNKRDTFRPHRDDSSPASGFADESRTTIRWSARPGETSHLTFLLYLNNDFEHGHTTFFPDFESDDPAARRRRVRVAPMAGSVLCFPQTLCLGGDQAQDMASPVHEGSRVGLRADGRRSRPKYVMRSDVLYFDDAVP